MLTWRKQKGRWGRSFRRRPCFWWSHDRCLTSQPEETRGPKADHPYRHFHWCDDRSLCYCGYACCIKEEGQSSMQGGHWSRRKCDAPLSLCKLFPNQLTKTGMPTGLRKCNTKLRVYNGTNIPQLGALDTPITWGTWAAQPLVSIFPEKWPMANPLKTHKGPAPWWGQPPLKMAGSYLHPPCSSPTPSKCAKLHTEPLARDEAPSWAGPCSSTPGLNFDCKLNTWSNLLETHRGPVPNQGPPLLKMASPYYHPPME